MVILNHDESGGKKDIFSVVEEVSLHDIPKYLI